MNSRTLRCARRLCLVPLLLLSNATGSIAQTDSAFPSKAIRVVVPAGAGGTADLLARALADPMARGLGHPWVVENRPGANGFIGSEAVARAAPDGYTLLLTSNTFIISPLISKAAPYDAFRDFAAIGLVASTANLLVAHPSLRVTRVSDLVKVGKSTKGGLAYASPAIGSAAQFSMERLGRAVGIELLHVPFKGPQQAVIETLAGRIPLAVVGVSNVLSHVQAGKLVALAVFDSQRSKLVPDVPTIAEAGVPDVDSSVWFAIYTPAGTPNAVVTRLNVELNAALRDLTGKLRDGGFAPQGGTPERLVELMEREVPIYAKIAKEANIRFE